MTKSMETHVDAIPKIFNSRKGRLMKSSRLASMWTMGGNMRSWLHSAVPVETSIKQDHFYLQF